jgi:prolyl-tRNA synthetase
MRYSQLFGQTLREAPADSPSAGVAFLARAAYLRSPASLLPLGQRAYDRLAALLLKELELLGGQEISPDADPFILAENEIQSYRQLPRLIFSRKYHGVNLAILAPSEETRDDKAAIVLESIKKVLSQLELPILVSAGGSVFSPHAKGNMTLLKCPACGYLESLDLAQPTVIPPEKEPLLPMEKILTPDCPTIEALAHFLNLPESKTAKALMLMTRLVNKEEFLFVVVRGDTSLSLAKLKKLTGALDLYPASTEQIEAAGAEPGYASPIGLKNVKVIVDQLIPMSPNLVAGANEHGYHLLNTNYGRDYNASIIADLTISQAGDPCPKCQASLEGLNAELLVGSEKFGASANSGTFTDEHGQSAFVWHGRMEIDLFQLLVAAAGIHHDDKGLTLPGFIAPYDVYLVALPGKTIDTLSPAEELYKEIQTAGISVFFDDRDERAGVKFNDADLIGCPVRITLGERNLQNGMVEFKRRTSQESQLIPLKEVISQIKPNG